MKKRFIATMLIVALFAVGGFAYALTFDSAEEGSDANAVSTARAAKGAHVAATLGDVTIGDYCIGEVDADQCVFTWSAAFNHEGAVENSTGSVVLDVADKGDQTLVEELVHVDVMRSFNSYDQSQAPHVFVKYREINALGKTYSMDANKLTAK